jgi:hypothetical protein
MEVPQNTGTTAISPKPKKNKLKRFLFVFTLSLVVICFIYYFICGLTYSEGTRSGILTKVSKKGYIFKTFEGELNVGGFVDGNGTIMPNSIFKFSVTKESVYKKLQDKEGKKVVLHYKQVIKNFFWQGDTDYFIIDVSDVKK